MKKKILISFVLGIATFSMLMAAVPRQISFQGKLTDHVGQPVTDTTDVTFRIYSDSIDGNTLWNETQSVSVIAGLFQVMLGSIDAIPDSVFSDNSLFLGITVYGDELSPRKPFGSSGFSYHAAYADSGNIATVDSWAIADSNIYRLYGNVGIGTEAPQVPLQILKAVSQDGGGHIDLNRSSDTTKQAYITLRSGDHQDVAIGLPANQSNVLSINAEKVGIGTTNPDQKLGIAGIIGVYPQPFIEPTSRGLFLYHGGDWANIYAFNYSNNTGDPIGINGRDVTFGTYVGGEYFPRLSILNNGNFGIGTTNPGAKLQINGDALVYGGSLTLRNQFPRFYIIDNAATGYLGTDNYGNFLFAPNNNEVMRVTTFGYVGIGTGNPTAKLEVAGDIRAASNVGDYSAVLNVNNSGIGRAIYASSNASMNRNAAIYGDALDNGGVGVLGHTTSLGVAGGSSVGVIGLGDNSGGSTGGATIGVLGRVNSYQGSGSVPAGVYGWGASPTGNTWGVVGETNSTATAAAGVKATLLSTSATGRAVWGETRGGGYAGYFDGPVHGSADLSIAGGISQIDNPMDPVNKYLIHSFVESPDMMNVYNGNIILNSNGEGVVELPAYFEMLNKDFRYQLTCIGGFAGVYIAEKITNNRFKIAGGSPGLEVSWQVTGVRQDAWANAHRVIPEVEKTGDERGKYMHPKELGKPETMGIDYHEPSFYGGR
jgi:hypothetical protein